MSFLLTMNVEVKPSRLLSANIHNRAHPRHYRAEYVRGYLHRQADVYCLPGKTLLAILLGEAPFF